VIACLAIWEKSKAKRWNCSMTFSLHIHIQYDWNLSLETLPWIRRWFHEKEHVSLIDSSFVAILCDRVIESQMTDLILFNWIIILFYRIYMSFYFIMLWSFFSEHWIIIFFGWFIMNFSSIDSQDNVSVGARAYTTNSTAKVSFLLLYRLS